MNILNKTLKTIESSAHLSNDTKIDLLNKFATEGTMLTPEDFVKILLPPQYRDLAEETTSILDSLNLISYAHMVLKGAGLDIEKVSPLLSTSDLIEIGEATFEIPNEDEESLLVRLFGESGYRKLEDACVD